MRWSSWMKTISKCDFDTCWSLWIHCGLLISLILCYSIKVATFWVLSIRTGISKIIPIYLHIPNYGATYVKTDADTSRFQTVLGRYIDYKKFEVIFNWFVSFWIWQRYYVLKSTSSIKCLTIFLFNHLHLHPFTSCIHSVALISTNKCLILRQFETIIPDEV